MLLSVIIPVYNEVATLPQLLERIRSVDLPKQVILVDDCSTDGSGEFLRQLKGEGITILFHERNQGKGAAIRTGLSAVQGDTIVIQDADLEYDPREYHRLVEPLVRGEADIVYGSRFQTGAAGHRFLFSHYWGNRFLTWLTNLICGVKLTDMETCYKMFRSDVLQGITLHENRFGFEPEFTAKMARRGYRLIEVPISYEGRGHRSGKKIHWYDGLRAMWCLVKYTWFSK